MYDGDLDINKDIVASGGDYLRTTDINSAIRILLGTDKNYWGNSFEKYIVGGLEDFQGQPIDLEFLRNYEAQLERCLQPLIDLGLASDVIASASNPYAEYINYEIKIIRTDKSEFIFKKGE